MTGSAAIKAPEYDVVIVGSGLAGLASAVFCSQAGLLPVVLEKARLIGGASCWSYGALWVGCNDLAAAAGIADDPQAVASYLNYLGGGENTPTRTRALLEHAMPALRDLRNAGIDFTLMADVNDILYGKAPGAAARGRTLEAPPVAGGLLGEWRERLRTAAGEEWRVPKSVIARAASPSAAAALIEAARGSDQIAQGAGLIARLMIVLRDREVPILTGVVAAALLTQSGRVTGVRSADGRVWPASAGVILACGNYLANVDWVTRLDRLAGYRRWFPETHTGDGIGLAAEIGGALGITRNNLMVMLGYRDPTATDSAEAGVPSVRDLPRAHTVVVNRAGRRFGNEALFQELAPALRALDLGTRQPANLPCWMIFDRQYVDAWGFAGGPRGTVPEWVHRADDLHSLGCSVGIDPINLADTVSRFNGFAASGVDEDYGRKPGWSLTPGSGAGRNASLGSLDQAPFYAVELYPTLGGGGAGLRADSAGRVLKWTAETIPGLYAVGDVAQHDEFGAGYQAGITFTSAITFAHLAVADIQASR